MPHGLDHPARTGDPGLRAAIAAFRIPVALISSVAALLVITIAGFTVLSLVIALLLALLAMFALWAPESEAPA